MNETAKSPKVVTSYLLEQLKLSEQLHNRLRDAAVETASRNEELEAKLAEAAKQQERMCSALKLVKILHDKPDCAVPGYYVRLDPKAYEQVSAAINACEEHSNNPGRCDTEIFENGNIAFTFHSPARVAELLVSMLARETNTRTDWHYVGGHAVVKTLDDVRKVREAARLLFPASINWKAGD